MVFDITHTNKTSSTRPTKAMSSFEDVLLQVCAEVVDQEEPKANACGDGLPSDWRACRGPSIVNRKEDALMLQKDGDDADDIDGFHHLHGEDACASSLSSSKTCTVM